MYFLVSPLLGNGPETKSPIPLVSHQSQVRIPRHLTFKEPFTTIAAFVASVDQDQTAQNVQPDL